MGATHSHREKGLTVCEWIVAGQIDAAEIQHSLRTIGLNISLEDANRILQRSAHRMSMSDITLGYYYMWI